MIWFEMFLAAVIALVLAAVFVPVMGWRRPGMHGERMTTTFGFLFLVLFLATWAGGLWIAPLGPEVRGVPWPSFLFAGLVVALLLAAVSPPRTWRRSPHSSADEAAVSAGMGVFFWLLVVFLLFAVVYAYAINAPVGA